MGTPGGLHRGLGGSFVAHGINHLRRGPDEFDVVGGANFGELGVFGEKAVAWVDGVGIGDFGGGDDVDHVEVRILAGRRTDAHGLVGKAYVEAVFIGGGIDGHGFDAHFLARTNDTQGNLTAVCNQYFFEHVARFLVLQ